MLLVQHESVYLILLFSTLKGESFCISAWSSLKLYVFGAALEQKCLWLRLPSAQSKYKILSVQ